MVDFVFFLDEMPRLAEKYRANGAEITGGGGAANAAAAIARLGGHAMLASRLGSDQVADMIAAGLEADGVDCTMLRRFEGRRSSFSSVFIDKAGERQIVNFRDHDLPMDAGWLRAALPDRFDAALADTRWPDGAEVLTHWMSHGYGHGDMVASAGVSRAMGLPLSFVDRRPRRVDERIAGYLDDLRPLGRTPYRLLTIGFDFVRPVPRLVELLDDWNERNHDRTGTWLVNATIEDYLDLVDGHRGVRPQPLLDRLLRQPPRDQVRGTRSRPTPHRP